MHHARRGGNRRDTHQTRDQAICRNGAHGARARYLPGSHAARWRRRICRGHRPQISRGPAPRTIPTGDGRRQCGGPRGGARGLRGTSAPLSGSAAFLAGQFRTTFLTLIARKLPFGIGFALPWCKLPSGTDSALLCRGTSVSDRRLYVPGQAVAFGGSHAQSSSYRLDCSRNRGGWWDCPRAEADDINGNRIRGRKECGPRWH
jgi:hypothetical protein